jgi:hypothetical protein
VVWSFVYLAVRSLFAFVLLLGVGCVNSCTVWIPSVCSEIVFTHPTGTAG